MGDREKDSHRCFFIGKKRRKQKLSVDFEWGGAWRRTVTGVDPGGPNSAPRVQPNLKKKIFGYCHFVNLKKKINLFAGR